MTEFNAKTSDGNPATIDMNLIEEFEAGFRGPVLPTSKHGYESARQNLEWHVRQKAGNHCPLYRHKRCHKGSEFCP